MSDLEGIGPLRSRANREVQHELAAALRLQRLLAEISSRFVTRSAGQVDDAIEESQRIVCEALGIDRSTLWQFAGDGSELAITHFWQPSGNVPLRRNYITQGNLPWAEGMVRRGESFHFSSLSDLPPEAARDVEILRIHGTCSNVTFPLVADDRVFGALAFAMTRGERRWSSEEIAGLKLVAQIFGQVVSRRQAEERADQLRLEIQRSARAAELGEIAAALAHEINQPLTTILANAQAARRFLDQGNADPAEIRAILDDIIRDDKRAGEVVRSLREMMAGSPALREVSCLNRLVTEVAGFLRSEMLDAGVELQLDLAPSLPGVCVARVEIQQLLINLISNATHAMSEIPRDHRRIIVRTRSGANRVDLQIQDRGCGISPEQLDRIFEPFHSTRSEGLGMGLAICRRIAESHGGTLHARNDEAGGAVFNWSVPSI